MAKNFTNIHKQMDRIVEKLSKLDTQAEAGRQRTDNQLRLMTRLLNATQQSVDRIAEIQADVALLASEARKEAKEARERITELAASTRRN